MKRTATDTAADATLLLSLRRAARVPTYPMCAEPRQVVTDTDGRRYLVCPRCGDTAPLPETETKETAR